MYSDIPVNVFEISNRWLLSGDSCIVKRSILKEFLRNTCNKIRKAFCIGFQEDNEITHLKKACSDCDVKAIIHRIDNRLLNHFELFDWYYLIEHFYSDNTRAEETKAYLKFIYELLEYMPEDISFLTLCERTGTVQDVMSVLSQLNKKGLITTEQYEKYKIKYLEVMASSCWLEHILQEAADVISLNYVSGKGQRILFWCMAKKAIQLLDDDIPIIIKHLPGDDLDVVYDLLIEINFKKILFISNDIFCNTGENDDFLTCFELSVFSRTSYMPSAKILEDLFGNIKKPHVSYTETYDCRVGKERWIDKLLKTNKTKTFSTTFEFEPRWRKEEIVNLEEDAALFMCTVTPFAERGYARCYEY